MRISELKVGDRLENYRTGTTIIVEKIEPWSGGNGDIHFREGLTWERQRMMTFKQFERLKFIRRLGDPSTVMKPIRPIRWSYYYACRFLAANGPQPADAVGAVVWKGKKRGKTTSSGGGGDYGAQMLLGRMKKAGLVRRSNRFEGCTLWEVTALGRKEAAK